MRITLDGARINSLDDFYDVIEQYLLTGECPWGRNLDSLDEIVGYSFNYTDNPSLDATEIEWSNSGLPAEKLGMVTTANWWQRKLPTSDESVFEHWTTEQKERIFIERNQIEKKIEEVQNGQSQTLFEMLVEILSSNPEVKLRLA